MRDRWARVDDAPVDGYAPGGPKVFLRLHTRPRSYYIALALADDILSKNVKRILHKMSDAYYLALIRLSTEALEKLDHEKLCYKEFVKAMKPSRGNANVADDPHLPMLDDVDIGEAEALLEDEMDAETNEMLVTLSCSRRSVSFADRTISTVIRGVSVRILYDRCSHSSGRQRAWAVCPNRNHDRCLRYQILDMHESDRHLRSYLAAWCVLGGRNLARHAGNAQDRGNFTANTRDDIRNV